MAHDYVILIWFDEEGSDWSSSQFVRTSHLDLGQVRVQ